MKITKTRLKQIIREELENLEEYSPYKTGARPDKPHKKPGETKDDGKYADPKRARPKKRYEEQQEEEVEENVRVGRRPRLQRDRAPSDDIDRYDEEQIQLRSELEAMGLGSFRHDPPKEDTDRMIKKINKMLSRNADPETVKKLKDLKLRVADLRKDDYRYQSWYSKLNNERSNKRREEFYKDYPSMDRRLREELTRQDKTDVKKMVQDELEKLLKKKDTKDQMGEIVKKIMKKLYKDLSLEHPYIIDRIKI